MYSLPSDVHIAFISPLSSSSTEHSSGIKDSDLEKRDKTRKQEGNKPGNKHHIPSARGVRNKLVDQQGLLRVRGGQQSSVSATLDSSQQRLAVINCRNKVLLI